MIDSNAMRIINIFIIPTGTTPDMVARNYTSTVGPNDINIIDRLTHGGTNNSAQAYSSIASNILSPDMQSSRAISIVNGFRTKRYRFLAIVGYHNENPVQNTRYYYSGYTDYCDRSTNDLPPDLKFFFNNVISVTRNGYGVRVNECNHVLHPAALGAPSAEHFSSTFNAMNGFEVVNQPSYVRPVDLMCSLDTASGSLDTSYFGGATIFDTRTAVQAGLSDRLNNVPAYYLEKSMNGLITGKHEANDDNAFTTATQYNIASALVGESIFNQMHFLNRLSYDFDYVANGWVSWATLKQAYPELNVHGVAKLVERLPGATDIFVPEADHYDSMVGSMSKQMQVVTQLIQSIPALLLRDLIVECKMHVTNMTSFTGTPTVTITDPIAFADLPPGYLIDRIPKIAKRLETVVFNNLAGEIHAPFSCNLKINTMGETIVDIVYNGEAPFSTAIPSYCDAIHSLVVAPSHQTLTDIASDLDSISSELVNGTPSMNMTNPDMSIASWSQPPQMMQQHTPFENVIYDPYTGLPVNR